MFPVSGPQCNIPSSNDVKFDTAEVKFLINEYCMSPYENPKMYRWVMTTREVVCSDKNGNWFEFISLWACVHIELIEVCSEVVDGAVWELIGIEEVGVSELCWCLRHDVLVEWRAVVALSVMVRTQTTHTLISTTHYTSHIHWQQHHLVLHVCRLWIWTLINKQMPLLHSAFRIT